MKVFKLGQGQKGFSLVELMIVVAIIGILAAIAVPRFQAFQAKAKQTEAKNNLSHIYTLQQAWFGEHDTYTTNLQQIGFNTTGTNRYAYTGTVGTASAFTANATAPAAKIMTNCTTADQWSINEGKVISAVYDCAAH